ncbi:hypothetical protein ACIXT9_02175 [Bacteroides fragilis]
MDNVLGQEYPQGIERVNYLRDNCDAVEELGYSKAIPADKMEELKDKLVDNNIQLRDVRADKRAANKQFNEQIKQLEDGNEEVTKSLKEKSEFVYENCFKFVEDKTRTVAYYNELGILVYSRPARPEELQGTIQMQLRRTGTEG